MATALRHNVMLEELDLRCNRITDKGYLALIDSLAENTSLKRLFIGENSINDEKIRDSLKQLATMPSLALELLDVMGNTAVIVSNSISISSNNPIKKSNNKLGADEKIESLVEEIKKVNAKFRFRYGFDETSLSKKRLVSKGSINHITNNYNNKIFF